MHKFTLFELLIVVGITGVLVTILLPSLQKAREAAKIAVCTSNQNQIGLGMSMYTANHNSKYPYHSGYGNMIGKQGASSAYKGLTPANKRPLNAYIGRIGNVAECPSDKGDSLSRIITNCYDYIGTSYLVQWRVSTFAVSRVTSNNYSKIATVDEWERPTKKIILSDWVWHGNRKISSPKTRWHSKGSRRFPTLFADGHVKYFAYPLAIEGWRVKAPDFNSGFY